MRPPLPRHRRTGGFTLVELIVAILVIAVLAAAAVASWGQHESHTRTTSAAATAALIRDALQARAAEEDTTASQVAANLWAGASGNARQALAAVGVNYDGQIAFTPDVAGSGTLTVVGGTSAPSACVLLPADTRPVTVTACNRPPRGTLTPAGAIQNSGLAPMAAVWRPDGRSFAVPYDRSYTVGIYSAADGTLTKIQDAPSNINSNGAAYSPDGQWLAVSNWAAGTVSMYPVAADGALGPKTDTKAGTNTWSTAFSPDGQLLAATNFTSRDVSVFKVGPAGALTLVGNNPVAGFNIHHVAFSPDGKLIVAAGSGTNALTALTVNTDGTVASRIDLSVPSAAHAFVFSPDGGRLFLISDTVNAISMFDVRPDHTFGPRQDVPVEAGQKDISISPDGTLIAYSTASSAVVRTLTTAGVGPAVDTVTMAGPASVGFSPDSRKLAIAQGTTTSGSVSIYDVA